MGCFNLMGCFSNIPILKGDEAYAIMLGYYTKRSPQFACYPSSNFYPIMTPFLGRYNEYGTINEIVPNASLDFLSNLGINIEKFIELNNDCPHVTINNPKDNEEYVNMLKTLFTHYNSDIIEGNTEVFFAYEHKKVIEYLISIGKKYYPDLDAQYDEIIEECKPYQDLIGTGSPFYSDPLLSLLFTPNITERYLEMCRILEKFELFKNVEDPKYCLYTRDYNIKRDWKYFKKDILNSLYLDMGLAIMCRCYNLSNYGGQYSSLELNEQLLNICSKINKSHA